MRICPTCGNPVAATQRCCSRCTEPLPDPGYPPDTGYPAEPGHPPEPGYLPAPCYPPEACYPPESIYRPAPGYLAEPGYPGVPAYPPVPGYQEPGCQEPGYQEPGYQPAPGYLPAADDEPGSWPPALPEPGWYEPDLCGVAAGDDFTGPEVFGDLFAGRGLGTGVFPARPAPEPQPAWDGEDTASRLAYPPPSGRPAPGHRALNHRALGASAALAAVALLAGVITAWAASGPPQAGPGSRLAGRQTTAARRASPVPRGRAASSPSPSPPAPGAAATVVTMAPGMSQAPEAAQVDGFLVSYFTAINSRDYEQYARLLVPARRAHLTAADFARGYGSTTDTGPSIVGISSTGPGVAATVTFTSQQRAAPGADVTSCTDWDITLYLRRQGGTLLLGNPPRAYHAYHHACT